jgi:hypothetical protein
MPFGLQIIGPRGGDALVLGVAASLERLLADDVRTARPVPKSGDGHDGQRLSRRAMKASARPDAHPAVLDQCAMQQTHRRPRPVRHHPFLNFFQ